MTNVGAVLVIGAGISGMQASLDLAESGFKVYLVEKRSAIGGKMAQLDKTFPTNDCAMCIMAPKMVEVGRHPNIELLTLSEVIDVKGKEGDFKVKVKKKARYVDMDKCTGCGECTEACILKKVPDEFNEGLSSRSAAYILFPQAIPLKATIDKEHCLFLTKGKCTLKCIEACEAKAIDLEQKDEVIEIDVGAIVVSTGYELFDPSALEEYGFGLYPNVLTNLQFERLLSASGPTAGHVKRPSDHEEPRKIAFIQCVGSRDVRHYPYCSQICCMASTKEAIIAREHNPDLRSYILYMDMRAFGKGFQEYVDKAREEYGTEYIYGRAAQVTEDPKTNNLIVSYENTELGKVEELEVDLVVLASALKPISDAEELAEILNIELDEYGYFKELSEQTPFETLKPGIYINGACQGPKDIPDSVAQASGAASQCEALLSEARSSLVEVKEEVPEKEISGEPRIGVFVCHCGLNIASVVDVASVVEYAKTLSNVVYANDTMYTCSDDTQVLIKETIKEHDLNRVVVASCTPRTHEPLFRETCEDAGLNPYLFEMANIREHCSWVHQREPEKATGKAKDLLGMAVAKARFLEPQKRLEVGLESSALVVGGGVAGLTAALEIATQGFNVDVVERRAELGGSINQLNSVFLEGKDPEEVLEPLIKKVEEKPNIKVHLNSTLTELEGFIGNFEATIQSNGESNTIKTGAIVVATGSEELRPTGYMYGENPNVMTQLELEEKLKGSSFDYETVVMIQCVGARDKANPGCSRLCCTEAVKNAMILKKKKPDSNVFVLFRDIMTFGKYEEYYKKSQELGVKYLRYTPERPPNIEERDGRLQVKTYDTGLGDFVKIDADKIVLTTPQIPAEGTEELRKVLKVPLSADGFFMEAHAKLRPLEFTFDGIYLCGSCQSPKELSSVIAQASGAASRVCSMLSKGVIETEAITSVVDPDKCISCANCEYACPYGTIKVDISDGISKSNPVLCKGCGSCAVECPAEAITMRNFTDDQIKAIIEAALATLPKDEPKIISFLCNWCAYAGADLAGVSRLQYPPNTRTIRMMCTGRIDPLFIYHAFLSGADGVLVSGCHIGDCHYVSGNQKAEKRMKRVKKQIAEVGLEPERLKVEWVSASEGQRFAEVVTQFTEELKRLSPSPLREVT
jgi:heterodisulfide reductase subunit A